MRARIEKQLSDYALNKPCNNVKVPIVIEDPNVKKSNFNHAQDVSCIIPPWLYLSGLAGAIESNISQIFSVGVALSTSTHIYGLEDEEHAPLKSVLIDILPKLKQNSITQTKTLVHCQMGMSRSAACVIAFLMKQAREAGDTHTQVELYTNMLNLVRSIRPCVAPNPGFERIIKEDNSWLIS